jgi:hypothetical protein
MPTLLPSQGTAVVDPKVATQQPDLDYAIMGERQAG